MYQEKLNFMGNLKRKHTKLLIAFLRDGNLTLMQNIKRLLRALGKTLWICQLQQEGRAAPTDGNTTVR